MMKISPAQIEQLYTFTRQHFVEYYDLQTELVDHLANAIEAESEKNPALSFDELLQSEFKKFGVFGFMDVIENRRKALARKYHKIVWKHFVEFFGLPKIIITAALFTAVFYALEYIQKAPQVYTALFGLLTMALIAKFSRDSYRRRKRQPDEKRWLFKDIIFGYGSLSAFLIVPLQLLNSFSQFSDSMFTTTVSLVGFSAFLVAYAVCGYILTIVIPAKADEYLLQTYPEYALLQ